jgi:hypothetical protein
LEKARMRQVLYGAAPDPALIEAFVQPQNPDGGFPCGRIPGHPSAVHATLNALLRLDELGVMDTPPGQRALGYLRAVQRADGGWDEDLALARYDLAPWIRPGDLRTRLYLSTYAAYRLILDRGSDDPATQAALPFLRRHRSETGRFYGFLHSTWIGASVFAMAGPPYDRLAAQSLYFLWTIPLSEWSVEDLCWALNCLGRAGVSRAYLFVGQGLDELSRRQQADGSWSGSAGDTLQALKALQRYGPLAPSQSPPAGERLCSPPSGGS